MRAPRLTLAIACAAIVATALRPDLLLADHRIASEPWRIFTGSLVHASWGHLIRDGALVIVVGAAYEARLAAAWPWVIALGLAAPPLVVIAGGDAGYYGLSGLAHAMLAAALADELARRRHPALVALAIAFAIKLAYEAIASPDASATSILPRSAWLALGPHVHQAPIAHLAGALAGVAVVLSRRASRRSRRSRSIPAPPATPA